MLPLERGMSTAQSRTSRLLLVDADGDARSFCAHSLRLASYSVRTVTDVPTAINALGSEVYDVVIVDIDAYMPDRILNPIEFRRASATPVRLIILYSSGRRLASGWDVHLTKPFLVHDLQRAVETALKSER
jgi:CheY-like chemotaxis protein